MNPKSIRPFVGSRNFQESRAFYQAVGFEETVLDAGFSVFRFGETAFYLQDADVKDWIDNTMVFMEVDDADAFYDYLRHLDLPGQFPGSRLSPVRREAWGAECFLHDPSGILWHFGHFNP